MDCILSLSGGFSSAGGTLSSPGAAVDTAGVEATAFATVGGLAAVEGFVDADPFANGKNV
jgi:hypothetical protein